jgi:hypothetical protein
MTTPVRPSVTYSGLYEAPIVDPKTGQITKVWYDALLGLTARSNTSGDLSASDLHAGPGISIAIVNGVPPTVTISATGTAGGSLSAFPVFGREGERGRMGPPGRGTSGSGVGYDFVPMALGTEPLTFVSNGAGQPILVPFLYP